MWSTDLFKFMSFRGHNCNLFCGFAPCVKSAQTSKQSGWVKGIYSGYESPEKQTIHITNNTRRQYNKYITYKCILYVGVVHMCVQCIHSSFISHSFTHTFIRTFIHTFKHSYIHNPHKQAFINPNQSQLISIRLQSWLISIRHQL